MKSKINRELIPVLEDVFVTEGIVDTFKGLAEKRSLRLAEHYIKGSILTVNKNIEKNAYVSGIDKSKGNITKVPTYKDYKTIERKLNLMLEDDNSPKKFKKIMADVNKLSAFLYDNRNGILKQVYTGKHKSRTGQLVYISMVVSLFYTALGLINKYGTENYDSDKKLNKESTMLIKVFASKATVNDFTNLVKHLPEFEKETLTEDVVDAETGEEIKDEDDTTEDDDLDSIEDIEDDGLNLTLDDISTPEDLAKALEDGKDDFLKLANEILLVQSRLGKIRTVEVKTLKLDEDTKNKMKFSNSLRTDTYISAETLESVGFNKPDEAIKNEIPEHYDQTIVLFVTYKSGSVAFATFDATKAYMDKIEDLKQFIFNTTSLYIKKLSKIRKYAVVESVNMRFYRKEQLTSAILKEKLQESFFDEMKEIKAKANEIEDGKFEEAWDVNNKDEQMHPLAYNAAHEILVPQREFGEFLGFELKLASGADFGKIAKDVDDFIAENHKELSDNTILYADAKYAHKASFPIRLWIFAPQENVSLDVCEEVVGDKIKWFINYLTQQNLKEVNDGAVNQYPVAESVTFETILSEDFVVKQPLQESGILGNSTTWDRDKKQKSIDSAAKRIARAQKKFGKIKGLNLKVLDPGKTRKMMLGKAVGNAILFSLGAAAVVSGEKKYRERKQLNPSYTVHNPDGTTTKKRARLTNADGSPIKASVNRKVAAGAGVAAAAATLAKSGNILTKKRGVAVVVRYEKSNQDVFLGLASEEQLQAGVHKEVFRALTQAVSRFRNLNEDALSDEEELANNPEAPRFPERTIPVKELTEGTIYSLIGEDEEFLDEDTTLTEDSLKDFILGGVSKTGKNIAKGVNTTKSVNIKAFFNNNYAKGIAVVGSLIALLFMTRYIITLVCMMRVNIAQYLRETASIIDEQIDAVNNMDTRTKQEEISAKLKNIADKFDLDTSVASNKAERANRDFDTELLDNFTDEELANDNGEENFNGGAFF